MTMNTAYPLALRWFIKNNLIGLDPWYFIDDIKSINSKPNFETHQFFTEELKKETAADFDVYLFARREDREDFAFFIVKDGIIEDKIITIHLSFSGKFEAGAALQYKQEYQSFFSWIQEIVIRDIEDCANEYDLEEI